MKKERQLTLWKARRRAAAPREKAEAPPRLVMGDPDSLAFKHARETELERQRLTLQDSERRSQLQASHARWIERRRTAYPDQDDVTAALRTTLSAPEEGMPRTRERIEAQVAQQLRAQGDAPLAHVHTVFDRLLQSGSVRYQGRRWSWIDEAAPPPPLPLGTLDQVRHHLAARTVTLRPGSRQGPRPTLGAGCLVTGGDGIGLVTTRSAWEAAREAGAALELVLGDGAIVEVETPLLESGERTELPGVGGEWGPDIAYLWLPGMVRWALARHGHVMQDPHATVAPTLLGRTLHLLAGDPHPVHVVATSRAVHEGTPHDYVDVRAEAPGLFLSGTPLFTVCVDDAGRFDGTVLLLGIAFRQIPGGVRCHGRESIEGAVPRPRREAR